MKICNGNPDLVCVLGTINFLLQLHSNALLNFQKFLKNETSPFIFQKKKYISLFH